MGKEARSVKVEYEDPPPAPLLDANEFYRWSFYRSIVAEFVATLLLLYVTVATVIGNANDKSPCGGVGNLGIAWSFGGMIFVLVYCTAGISGGHLNPAVTFGLFVARKVTLNRTVLYMVAQCLGAICGAGMVKALQKTYYSRGGGGANSVSTGFANGTALAAEIVGTFVLVYTVFCSMDPKSNARDAHVPSDYFVRKWDVRLALDDFYTSLGYLVRNLMGSVPALAPLSIGFAVFLVHLATIPITGTGINPARSFGAAVIYGHKKSWDDHWIFWVGPLIGATVAAVFHKYVIRAHIKWHSKEPNHV